jgi:ATP-dependent helicase YprA (DUF1998 family)
MLPSLVAPELRAALTDYLRTTFALADEDVQDRLTTFLTHEEHGIFRGPYVRLRLPFQSGDSGDGTWRDALDWMPDGFRPHRHQAEAFRRLSSKHGRPRPTLVTTGTGSGKTESFLIPVLDHCRRARSAGQTGIKALILYPMNALANDQARRIAAMLADNAKDLGGVTAGLYTGDSEAAARGGDLLVRHRRELRDNPPDILLTNYKMLDFLLLRPEDAALWAGARDALQYLVLDEFHTYDGAQGTDVAMLLRRLGMALGTVTAGRPLGRVTPVATSATLGGGGESGGRLLDFAGRVFGEPFDASAVIGERRLTADEWLAEQDTTAAGPDTFDYEQLPLLEQLPEPVAGQSHLDRLAASAAVFFRDPAAGVDNTAADLVADRHRLGQRLSRHPLTRALLKAAATPRSLAEVVREVAPHWAGRDGTERVITDFLALLSHARSGDRPLVQVEIQLWVREVRRVDRVVDTVAEFRWGMDSPRNEIDERFLPAVYCRHCGRSGWGSARRSRDVALETNPRYIGRQSMSRTGRFRALIHAPGERRADDLGPLSWLDPVTLELHERQPAGEHECLPVLATPDDEQSKKDTCPSCRQADGVRFLGSRVATLTSVALGHLFGSADIDRDEKKTLVFTDSVQDAAHRAGFIESRAFTFNFRSLLIRAARDNRLALSEIGPAMVAAAKETDDRFALLPPEMADAEAFRPFWEKRRGLNPKIRALVTSRVAFGAVLEFGLSARTGRTLELTATMTGHVNAGSPRRLVTFADAVIGAHRERYPQLELAPPEGNRLAWVRGVLERMRLRGGIHHPWLNTFIREDGNRWSIWGGRTDGMPAFPSGRPAPAFPTTAGRSEAFDSVVAKGTWYCRWTARCLGVAESDAPHLVRALFEQLHREDVLTAATTKSGATVYYFEPDVIELVPPAADEPESVTTMLRCEVCSLRFPGVRDIAAQLLGAPCLRDRCVGHLHPEPIRPDYYRALYSSRRVRRIKAHEHTGMLDAASRVAVENAFKSSPHPDAPNVLTCTPTLELGIDIGDLSAVGLTSLPRRVAGYLQRVGRAGRQTGNALIFAVLPGVGIELHWLAEPLDMLDGEVTPPACHLDATEIIRRQYLASLIDRTARQSRVRPPRTAGKLFAAGLAEDSWLRTLLRDARTHAADYVNEFLDGFRGHITADTETMLADWAGVGLDADEVCPLDRAVERAVRAWQTERAELAARVTLTEQEVARLDETKAILNDTELRDLQRTKGELRAARNRLFGMARQYWITAFEALGLLPNYTLLDDRTQLDVGLTWTDEHTGQPSVERITYERGSRVALAELAPGNTFYVDGAALRIDAVDLGTERNPLVMPWRFCPRCGWSAPDTGPTTCPRCHDNRTADTGQVLQLVRFRRASAFASRDSSRFGDEDEDRKRIRFTITAAVDVPEQEIERAWRLREYPFGAEFVRNADIRWVNLGRADTGGADRTIAGDTVQAPLFLACRHCGVVPAAQDRVRDVVDARHRGWCPQRRIQEPDGWVSMALLHELRTQVVRLLVPPIVIADDIQLESTRAALLLGLRKVLGGEPDHLDVLVAPDPDRHGERYVLVLHDRVPGGTGYLARFTDPERVRELLTAAHKALVDCTCAERGVQACHRCLLPYAPPSAVPIVRRDRAADMLGDILAHWQPEDITSLRVIEAGPHETPIELRFRALLRRWAKQEKAEPRLTPGQGGDRLEFTISDGADSQTWTVEAQPGLGYVRPDFVLSSSDASVPKVAVFCDSRQFHATAEHNRLGDDAEKRASLREEGYLVWAVTHDDLDAFEQSLEGTPTTGLPVLTGAQQLAFDQLTRNATFFGPRSVPKTHLQGDAVTVLTHFLSVPRTDRWLGPASAVALALSGGNQVGVHLVDREALPELLTAELRGSRHTAPRGSTKVLVRRSAGGAVALVNVTDPKAVSVLLGLDDRPESISAPELEPSWRDWLALSNVLQFLDSGRFDAGTSSTPAPGIVQTPQAQPARTIDVNWRPLIGAFGGPVDVLIGDLAARHIAPPEPGYEALGGEYVIDLAWPSQRIAVVMDEDTDRDTALRTDGWTVLGPNPDRIVDALAETGAEH